MRVIGLLSWFDEDPEHLRRAIGSHAPFVDAFVCLDGRYALYGSGPSVSAAEQYDAIAGTCAEHGLDLALVSRGTPWAGEVHKRGHLFRHGLAMAEVGRDWFWIVDGDNELIEHEGIDAFRARLASTPHDVAEVILSEPGRLWQDVRRPMRQVFRALPGFAPYGRHWHYVAKSGGEWVYLWGPREKMAPALEMPEVVVRHHHMDREQRRRNTAYSYYARRDERQVETSPGWVIEGPDGYPERADNEGELA